MQTRKGAILCTILAGALVAVAGAAAADTCQAGPYTVSTTGPVLNAAQTQTSITYVIEGGTSDHIASVVASASTNCSSPSILSVTGSGQATGNQSYAPAVGDPITGLGKLACHEEAAKINPAGTRAEFTITVSGARGPTPKTVVVKKGGQINRCEIVGIGEPGTAEVEAPVTEIIRESGSECAVEFTLDRLTGKVLHVEVAAGSAQNCTLTQTPVENLNLSVSGLSTCTTANQPNCCPPDKVNDDGTCAFGTGRFGMGYVHSNSQSCTTRVIGGTLYSWGAPCP